MPQLQTVTMQFGWSGDTARGMNSRVIHDVLPFKPTVATRCYGMNGPDILADGAALQAKLWAREAKYAEDVRPLVTPVQHTLTVEPA